METKRTESQWRLFGMALCAVGTACADVVTNVWQTPLGGEWSATNAVGKLANWEGESTYADLPTNAIARFRLADKAQVYVVGYEYAKDKWFGPYFGGFDVASTDEAPADASWTFTFAGNTRPDLVVADAGFGYTPFHVANGTLSFDSNIDSANSGFSGFHTKPYWTVRKTGEGALRLGAFVYQQDMRTVLEVAAGDVRPAANAALAFTDVQVVESGRLTLDAAAPAAHVGSLTVTNGTTVALNGAELVLGGLGAAALDAAVTGSGRVTATVDDLVVTNPVAEIEYGAVAGRLRLDTTDGLALPFARYGFEESLTKDDSGQGRTLVPFGAEVSRVWDEERNSYVAHFTGAAGGLTVSVPDGGRLVGDADYTVSLWAKVAKVPADNANPTLFTLGESDIDRQLVQGRFTDDKCASMLFGHWCGEKGDFTNVLASSSPMAWHHYVFQRLGGRCTVWVDGVMTFEKETTLVLALSEKSVFTLGSFPEKALEKFPRSFHGDIDDVRVYSSAVGAAGVRRLYAGLEPFAQAGRPAASDKAPELPDGLRLRTALNGEILLGDGAVVSNVLGNAQRGGLVLPKGGTLTMTGPGRYDAGVAGATDFEKAGAGTLTVGGNLSHTGATKVAAGTLRLASWATTPALHAAYDFEESLTHDAGPDAIDFDQVAEVARVWDEDRKSFVAEFPGTERQRLCIDSYARASLYGDSDYTISIWVKPAEGCSSEGTFLSLGAKQNLQQIVFRYGGSGKLVLSHWGETYDYTGIDYTRIPADPDSPETWHHYVATRCGNVFTVYRDGKQFWTANKPQKGNDSPGLSLPAQRKLYLGLQFENSTRYFKGRIDDVRIYATALDAAAVARLHQGEEPIAVPRGGDPAAVAAAPEPVSRWSFEDADNLGRDTMNNHPLKKEGGGEFTLVDSPLGGKALRFPAAVGTVNDATAWLRTTGGTFRSAGANRPFSVSMWVQTSSGDQEASEQRPYFLYLGKPSEIGYMFGFWHDRNDFAWSLRDVLVKKRYENKAETSLDVCSRLAVRGLHESDAALRWHHYAKVYDPQLGFLSYVDGQFQPGMSRLNSGIDCRDMADVDLYLGIRPDKPKLSFRGAIDEVRFYDCVLSGADVRAIMREDQTRGLAALPPGTAVDVASGATLDVNGTDETVAALTGAGTVALTSGRLAVTGETTFEGVLSGAGTVRLPTGGALKLTQTPTAFTGYFEMAGGTLDLAGTAQPLAATFRVCTLDATAQVSYPGEVELPAGLTISLTADNPGPFVTAQGRLVVAGGGTVVLPDGKTTGTWVIARGTSVEASEEVLASWRVANAPASVRWVFQTTASGDFVCRVFGQGTCVILR